MNQRDRYWATAVIWLVFIVLFYLVLDRGLLITADFAGLWPPAPAFPQAQDAEQLRQVIDSAQQALPDVLARVQNDIQRELALRMPFVVVSSLLLVAAATICTYFVWRNAGLEAYLAREVVQSEKAKRRSRIEQFMEDLDSDELDQLRARLSGEGHSKGSH